MTLSLTLAEQKLDLQQQPGEVGSAGGGSTAWRRVVGGGSTAWRRAMCGGGTV